MSKVQQMFSKLHFEVAKCKLSRCREGGGKSMREGGHHYNVNVIY